MKKIYTLIAAVTVVLSANAQRSNLSLANTTTAPVLKTSYSDATRAAGDTLFYFDGNAFYGTGISATSTPPFAYTNDDVDGLTANAAMTPWLPVSDWKFFYDLNSVTGDTNSFLGATSWFTPAATSDDWFAVGPITIPAAGAVLSWKHNMPDGAYRDGYKVFVSTTGLSNYTDFTNPAIFTVADMAASTAGDTVNTPDNIFASRTTSLAAYAGQDIYIGYQHQANDMFILYLDDILVTEGPMGVNEFVNGAKLMQNMPNPASANTTITYQLEKNASVALNVYDVTGKVVASQVIGEEAAGTHNIDFNTANLAAGIYHYALTVDNAKSTAMKMVVIK